MVVRHGQEALWEEGRPRLVQMEATYVAVEVGGGARDRGEEANSDVSSRKGQAANALRVERKRIREKREWLKREKKSKK